MECRQPSIFVLDVVGRPAFAFEAENLAQAEEFIRAPWFVRALGEFCATKHQGWDRNIPVRTRVAAKAEASIFADELADLSDRFLIAHLSSA